MMITIAINTAIERYCRGFLRILVTFGRYCPHRIPSTSGIPMMMKMLWKISPRGISSSGRVPIPWLPAKLRYILPQNAKLSGVVKTHAAVLKAVRETDSSEFPLESEVMKFEMFPPGHDATRIIPKAIIGESQCPQTMVSSNVSAGSSTS